MHPWKALLCIALVLILALLAVVLHRLDTTDARVTTLERQSRVVWSGLVSEPIDPIHTAGCPVLEGKRGSK